MGDTVGDNSDVDGADANRVCVAWGDWLMTVCLLCGWICLCWRLLIYKWHQWWKRLVDCVWLDGIEVAFVTEDSILWQGHVCISKIDDDSGGLDVGVGGVGVFWFALGWGYDVAGWLWLLLNYVWCWWLIGGDVFIASSD